MSDKQLMRSEDRMIAGVAGGLADYFDTDPTQIRILFVLLTLLGGGGLGILIYIVLWIVCRNLWTSRNRRYRRKIVLLNAMTNQLDKSLHCRLI